MAALSILDGSISGTSLFLAISSAFLLLLYYLKRKTSYWARRGVAHLKPVLFFGNTFDLVLSRTPHALVFKRIYDGLAGHKLGGFWQLTKPTLILRDPDLIKSVLIKNFSHFHDRPVDFDEEVDPLSANLFDLPGKRWKDVRAKLSPTFTSGKLKLMYGSLKECISALDDHLADVINRESGIVDVQGLMSKFSMDVIGACVFGLRCDAVRDETSEFRQVMGHLLRSGFGYQVREALRRIDPRLVGLFRVKESRPKVGEFFRSLIRQVREQDGGGGRNDFLKMMLDIQTEERKQADTGNGEARNGERTDESFEKSTEKSSDILFTDSIVAANAVAFFEAGYSTVANSLSFCIYELALNPEICEKLRDEVDTVKGTHNGTLDFDALKELHFMDAVIAETLRMHPATSVMDRECTESFLIPGTTITIEKGTEVIVPHYALHHDPQYFPEPDKFLPDRFTEENKSDIRPGTYMPFGDGPRTCIGMRFAMLEMKSALSHLVSNYSFQRCKRTAVPLKFALGTFTHAPEGGVFVQLLKRP